MSLEQALVAAASAFLAAMNSAAQPPTQASTPAFVPPQQAPVTPAFVPPVAPVAAPPMPGLPNFAAPAAAAPVAQQVPFSDQAGLIAWTTAAYHALGPKGEGIGQIMQSLGAGAISDIKPEQYAQFVAAVEALRG